MYFKGFIMEEFSNDGKALKMKLAKEQRLLNLTAKIFFHNV